MQNVRKYILTDILYSQKQSKEVSIWRVSENTCWLTRYTARGKQERWAYAEYQKIYADSLAIQPQATKRGEQMHSIKKHTDSLATQSQAIKNSEQMHNIRKYILTHILFHHKQSREVSTCRVSETQADSLAI